MKIRLLFSKGAQIYLFSIAICFVVDSTFAQVRRITPERLIFDGDVTTQSNAIDSCTKAWIAEMPKGSILLGVNPKSCNPNEWIGANAKITFNIDQRSFPLICVLKISSNECEDKGLHSPDRNKITRIQFDGKTIWSKRTEIQNSYTNNFYAADQEPIQTTAVLRTAGSHEFTIIVPEKTAWKISQVELFFYDYPQTMRGIGYSPYRDCQYPSSINQQQPTIENVREDLIRLSHTCTCIRTYSSTGIESKIPAIAKSLGLNVFAGVSIDGNFENPKNDNEEIDSIISLTDSIDVDGIIVGNEYFLRHKDEPDAIDYLNNCITRIREGIKNLDIPILTAEIAYFANDSGYATIKKNIDKLLIHIYPFWDAYHSNNTNISIVNAAELTIKSYKEFEQKIKRDFPERDIPLIIGELGWPSHGPQAGKAVPSFENQRKYLQEILDLTEKENIDFMYFDAFNELWKIEEGLLGQHWGYSYSDRTAKYNFYGVLIPPELIPAQKVDLPPSIPFLKEDTTIYKILSEWPINQKSYKITTESLNRINSRSIPESQMIGLKNLLNREFIDQDTFLNTVTNSTKIYGYLPKNFDNKYDLKPTEKKSNITRIALEYSTYHYFFPRFMGDYNKITMNECDKCNPVNGNMSTKIAFKFDGKNKWCGIYWLPNYDFEIDEKEFLEWEYLPGVNINNKLNDSDSIPILLTFFARGEKGTENVQFKVKGIKDKAVETRWINLDKSWKKYTIDLSKQDLSDVVGGFCCISNKDRNPKTNVIIFFLDDIQYELKSESASQSINYRGNLLESNIHRLQFYGDTSSRSTNFFESNYGGMVFSGTSRIVFSRFSRFLDFKFPIPEPFISGSLKRLTKIDWEDRFDYSIGIEWRPFSKIDLFDKLKIREIKELRFYVLLQSTAYLQYQTDWSWRPKKDFRYGVELYREYFLYDTNTFWSEIWADASWRKTNFFINDFESWTLAVVPRVGIKIFPQKEYCIMPYITGELAMTQRYEFWQNRLLFGTGIRIMPFRWNETMANIFLKGLRLYVEGHWLIYYFDYQAPNAIPDYDIRAGINYTINWW